MSYQIRETYVNVTKGYRYYDSEIQETYIDSLGELFKKCQREFGRCASKVYVDTADPHNPQQVGWVFVRNEYYSDARPNPYDPKTFFLREVWVMVYENTSEQVFA